MPVKAFTAAKGRLSVVLDRFARADLARWLAGRVVAAAGELPTFIACDDDEVAAWADDARRRGAVEPGPRPQRRRRRRSGDDRRQGLRPRRHRPQRPAAGRTTSTPLAVARHHHARARPPPRRHQRDGPARSSVELPAAYGGGSFARHFAAAVATGRRVEVRPDPRLSLDVDTPADLAHPTLRPHLPTWLRTNLDSRPLTTVVVAPTDRRPGVRRWPIGAHPDDVEFGAGGTLAKWAAAGCVVHHLVCTDGSKGTWDVGADLAALVARRREEQREAARRLAGAQAGEVRFLGARRRRPAGRPRHRERGRPDHPRAAPGRRARPRSVEALPAAPRPPPRRVPRLRRHRRRPRPALLPRARPRPTTARRRCSCGRPTRRTTSRTSARSSTPSWPPSRPTRASSRRRCTPPTPASSAPSAPASADRLAELGAPHGMAAAEVFARLTDL